MPLRRRAAARRPAWAALLSAPLALGLAITRALPAACAEPATFDELAWMRTGWRDMVVPFPTATVAAALRKDRFWADDGAESLSALGPLPRAAIEDAASSAAAGEGDGSQDRFGLRPLELEHAEDAAAALDCKMCEWLVERVWAALADQLHASGDRASGANDADLAGEWAASCGDAALAPFVARAQVKQMGSTVATADTDADVAVARVLMFMATARPDGAPPPGEADWVAARAACTVRAGGLGHPGARHRR